jgi:hypothetical protein
MVMLLACAWAVKSILCCPHYGVSLLLLSAVMMAFCYNITAMSDQSMVVLWNCLDSQKDVPGSHSEACPSSPHSGDQAVDIKVEEFSDVEVRDDPAPKTFMGIKAEHEVSCVSVCPLLGICHSYSEIILLFLVSKVAKKKTDGTQQLSV